MVLLMSAGYPTGRGLTICIYTARVSASTGKVVKGPVINRSDAPSGNPVLTDTRVSIAGFLPRSSDHTK